MATNWRLIQKAINNGTSLAWPSNVTQGNLLIVLIESSSSTITSIVDTRGTIWVRACNTNLGIIPRCWIFFGIAKSSGPNTVTPGNLGGDRVLSVLEYSGRFSPAQILDASKILDSAVSNNATSASPNAGGLLVRRDNSLVICFWGSDSNPGSSTAGAGFTQQSTVFNGASSSGGVEDGIFSKNAVPQFTIGGSVNWGCVAASFNEAPPAQNQWAFNPIRKFVGGGTVPDASGSWSDTLTWTPTHTAVSVDADLADTVTWTATHTATDVDDPVADTLTWTDTFTLVSVDASLADTLTWTDTVDSTGVDAETADTVTWSDSDDLVSTDADLSDTLTWTTEDTLVSVDVDVDDTLTWTPADTAIPDGDFRHILTWSDSYEGLPEVETLVTDLLLWSQEFSSDILLADAVTWLDAFVYDGEVFPPLDASWSDTLTWDMQPVEANTWSDTLTWDDRLELPVQNVRQSETLTWADAFAPDVNLLAFARYRR